jgi:hypothetical protein
MSVQEPSYRAMPAALAGRRAAANLLTRDEARGLPLGITRMPELPRAEQPARMRCSPEIDSALQGGESHRSRSHAIVSIENCLDGRAARAI